MKKFIPLTFFLLFSFISVATFATTTSGVKLSQEKTVDLYFFWSHNCPHCVAAHPLINKLKEEYPWLKVHSLEASSNPKNARLFEKMARQRGKEPGYFPTFFICDKVIVGYTSAQTTGQEIRNAINECHNQ